MQVARREVERLARPERHPVQEQRRDRARVPGVTGRQVHDDLGVRAASASARPLPDELVDHPAPVRGRKAQQTGEGGPERGVGVGGGQVLAQGVGEFVVEPDEVGDGGGGFPEAAQGLEGFEGQEEFGLVVRVAVVAVRRVHGDARALLGLVAGAGAVGVGVHLEGEGASAARYLRR